MLVHDAIEGKQYQAILASMSTVPGRKRKAEHAMWKHVKTASASFAWLSPELANAFCWDALQKDGIWKYGNLGVAHLGLGRDFSAQFVIQDLYFIWGKHAVPKILRCLHE